MMGRRGPKISSVMIGALRGTSYSTVGAIYLKSDVQMKNIGLQSEPV
jgi:hypothetical protein